MEKNLYQFSGRNSIGIETSNTEDIKTHNITTSFWKKIRSRWFVKMPIIMSIDFSCQENWSECGTLYFFSPMPPLITNNSGSLENFLHTKYTVKLYIFTRLHKNCYWQIVLRVYNKRNLDDVKTEFNFCKLEVALVVFW